MNDYRTTIGLEIHAELKTQTKMFCECRNDPDEGHPNVNICPVCMAHPGTLPVINKEAVRHVLRVGTALGAEVADYTEFDRKNYFYPDIPKNYQISQYKYPLVQGGALLGIPITRVHLEEDTARSSHSENDSLVDYNRAGVPLMELVTDPAIHTAADAVSFARELRNLLRFLGASDANLEKGEMRVEANISISKEEKMGTKVEVKNLNSFKAVEQAIAYELARHRELLDRGEKVLQETRGWDENKQKTFSQRLKEESHDYRYFPDPDLPKLMLSEIPEFSEAVLEDSLPELPWERRSRYVTKLGLQEQAAETILVNPELSRIFDEALHVLSSTDEVRMAGNYLSSDVVGAVASEGYHGRPLGELNGGEFAKIIALTHAKTLSSRGAKDLLALWLNEGGDPNVLAKDRGFAQVSDTAEMTRLALDILSRHPEVVEQYRGGKESSLQFLVGQGMKESRGKANPEVLQEELVKAITSS